MKCAICGNSTIAHNLTDFVRRCDNCDFSYGMKNLYSENTIIDESMIYTILHVDPVSNWTVRYFIDEIRIEIDFDVVDRIKNTSALSMLDAITIAKKHAKLQNFS